MAKHLTRRRLGLFVVVLAVDHRREAVARVALDALPDVQHRPAGRVDDHAADGAQALEIPHRHAERRDDHHVVRADARRSRTLRSAARWRNVTPIAASFALTCGLWMISPTRKRRRSGNFGASRRRSPPRGPRRSRSRIPGRVKGQRARDQLIAVSAHPLDDRAVVVRRPLALDLGLEAETAAEVGGFHAREHKQTRDEKKEKREGERTERREAGFG